MARLKRLTRRQKQMLTRIRGGRVLPSDDPADLQALEAHGLIKLDNGRWVAVEVEDE